MFQWSSVCGSRPAVMGIVNVTPDSFSDGGRYLDARAAVARGLDLVAAGADLLDVGGESTRPGAEPVALDEELRRVLPVVEALSAQTTVPVSIDTTKAAVAAAALAAGARVVNDVSAGRVDPEILDVVATTGAGYVAMHMLGEPRTMQDGPRYDDVVREVGDALVERLKVARAAGIADGALAADPGIGFGKTTDHNLELLARLSELCDRVQVPLVVGASRKSFLGRILCDSGAEPVEPPAERRDDATLAAVVWSLDHGAAVVRVHDARRAAHAVALLGALQRAAA
jgi:dihydropteroate synthase